MCVCSPGFVQGKDSYSCEIPPDTTDIHEFTFDCCSSIWQSNGVTLYGDSFDHYNPYPLPVQDRGVFLNNRTYFKIQCLDFASNFGFNAWINSHDTGYATLLSINAENEWGEDIVSSFSWRVANRAHKEYSRKSMIELRDWTNHDTKVAMLAYDKSYCPKNWSNIALSVFYNWNTGMSTICFYGAEDG